MKLMFGRIACFAFGLFVASCGSAKHDCPGASGGRGGSAAGGRAGTAGAGSGGPGSGDTGGVGGGTAGVAGSASGGTGGGGGTAGAGGAADDCTPSRLCPAVYSPNIANDSIGCTPAATLPCWQDVPCGAGRKISGAPDFEDSVTCIYDGQGALVSATTCGYVAHNHYCRQLNCSAALPNLCDGSPMECFRLGADVTCPGDAGTD